MRIQSFWGPWNNRQDVVDDSAGCGGRHEMQTRGMWRTTFCEARRTSPCHSPQTTYSSKSTCCVLSAQKTAMYVVVYADRLTTQHSIDDISDWSWSYWQICYPSWHVKCFWPALAAHKISSAVLPQHPRREIVPYRVGWNHLTIDFRGSVCPLIDSWLNMLMFNASEYGMFNF